jgi:tetratricopeptide (TPR) repeat protein
MLPMRRIVVVALGAFVLALLAWAGWQRQQAGKGSADADRVPVARLEGLGSYRMPVRAATPTARAWFDQGLVLAYAFNHDAAARSFLKAAEHDPRCAMCWWGAALVLGPHLNAAMDPSNAPAAFERVQRAARLARAGRERDLVDALSRRYAVPSTPADRPVLDQAYAQAMRDVVARHPDDIDVRVLLAEALMDLHPWDFHDRAGEPRAWTGEIVALLEGVLREAPEHPGANHLYIHVLEASRTPERALDSARRLHDLAPGAGHLVHMSAHIYMRTGRYHEASEANLRAITADRQTLIACGNPAGLYRDGYVPHNHHFLHASSMMEGASRQALDAADEVARRMDVARSRRPGYEALQHYWVTPYLARVRFGRWDELAALPAPPADLPYPTAIWHYARGMGLLRLGHTDQAMLALQGLATIAAHPEMEAAHVWGLNSLASILRIAERQFAGELASVRGDHAAAIGAMREAVALQDQLDYDEPEPWYMPARQALGAVLLAAGRPDEAQLVYEEDLRRHPENGWSLFGLVQALDAQRRPAQEARARLQAAWRHADVKLQASRF